MYKNTPSNQNNSNSEKPKSFFDKYLIEGFVDRLAEFGLRLDTTDEVVSVRRNVEIKEPPLECAKEKHRFFLKLAICSSENVSLGLIMGHHLFKGNKGKS